MEFTAQDLNRALDRAADDQKTRVLARMGEAATSLVAALKDTYRQGKTGNLRRGVTMRRIEGGYIVRSGAPHSHILERGTKDRRNYTRKNAFRGKVTARHLYVPVAVRERQSYLADAQRILNDDREVI